MKRIITFITLILVVAACKNSHEVSRYLLINNERYEIKEAVIEYLDTSSNMNYSRMAISFRSSKENPDVMLTFVVYATQGNTLQDKTYNYAYTPSTGNISHVSFGESIIYDEYGDVLSGINISESSASISGSVSVERKNEALCFQFNLEADEADTSYIIRGVYNDKFREAYVYY